jgi:kumamolisin
MLLIAAIAGVATTSAFSASGTYVAIPGSFEATGNTDLGAYSSERMSVSVVLAPSNGSKMSELLAGMYDPQSANYGKWLPSGEFYTRFAPSADQIAKITSHLQASGLSVERTSYPFVLRASGPSREVEAALGTTLHTYRSRKGTTYFANASEVRLPTEVAGAVLGVVGLTNTVRLHSLHRVHASSQAAATPACDTPYPTVSQIVGLYIDGTGFPYGYGAGPGCSGLTPSQTNSIYGAPEVGRRGKGAGVNIAVFELSAYQRSDIQAWAQQFYGAAYKAPLVDAIVDGGPLAPVCPTNDTCPANYNGYSGDIEVDADIEIQLAVAPDVRSLIVYNAPNDYTGQTELDEYTAIADANAADVISSSWSVCENDVTAAMAQAENLVFEQMALQGQSMFGAAGDTGAFECLRSDGTTIVNSLDPPSQPWVTSVGGTSFDYNPNVIADPRYPRGLETVWNVDNLCNSSANSEGTGYPGLDWCSATGAGGGGSSQFWGRPFYQFGPGITNPYTEYGNGTTNCALARSGTPCREVPDISANADEWTGYAEYCTGSAATPYSTCATFSGGEPAPGWFQIGGTSLSSPLVSAVFADRVGYTGRRIGNANPLIYLLYNIDARGYFNDITGIGQTTNNNGLFPVLPGYDMATGVGTPKMGALITGTPQQ